VHIERTRLKAMNQDDQHVSLVIDEIIFELYLL